MNYPSAQVLFVLQVLTVMGLAAVSARLWMSGLHRHYRVFFVYLLFAATRSTVLAALPTSGDRYFWIWILTAPALWIFYILVVLELYSLVLEKHRGLYSMGRWLLYGALPASISLSVLSLVPTGGIAGPQGALLHAFFLIERAVVFSLLIFLLLILLFLGRYPIRLSRNVIVYSIVYAVFFLSRTVGLLVRTLFGVDVTHVVNVFCMGVGLACIGIWLFALSRKGETFIVKAGADWREGQEQRLLRELESLNGTLLRIARK
jgi:hypothetical protein